MMPMFTPEQAWNIDTKLDDGKPAKGKIITRVSCVGGGCRPNCNTAADNTAASANAAEYLLTGADVACALYVLNI